jgi:hypothetical protein
MSALAAVFVFFVFAFAIGLSFLAAAAGKYWVLAIALVAFFVLFGKLGCLPSSGSSDHH